MHYYKYDFVISNANLWWNVLFIILNNLFVLFKILRIWYNFTSYLQIFNGLQYQNGSESNVWLFKICTVIAKKKKKTFSEKAEQRSVIKFCAGIGNTLTETHKFLKQSEKHKNVSRSSVFKCHERFSDKRENVMDDVRDGKLLFQNFGPWKMKIVTILTVIGDWEYVKLQKNVEFQRQPYMTFYLKI